MHDGEKSVYLNRDSALHKVSSKKDIQEVKKVNQQEAFKIFS